MKKIFAKVGAAKTSKSKESHKEVIVTGKNFSQLLTDFIKFKKAENIAKAQKEAVSDEIKREFVKPTFLSEYEKNARCPESFFLVDEAGNRVLSTVKDAYKVLKAAEDGTCPSYNALAEKYGERDKKGKLIVDAEGDVLNPRVVEFTTTYTFNNELLEKYGEQIEKAIQGLKIPDEDKEALVIPVSVFRIKKGVVKELVSVSRDTKIALEEIVEDIQPIVALSKESVVEKKDEKK